jgi:hypothetical protein
MATQSLSDHVKKAFGSAKSKEYAKEYLETIHANWRDAESRISQSLLSLVFFISVFELLTRAAVAEVTLGPFKVTDLAIIQKILPLIVAYFFFEFGSSTIQRNELSDVYYEIIRVCHKSISSNNLQYYLSPRIGFFLFGNLFWQPANILVRNIQYLLQIPIVLFAILGPTIFEIYAFLRLFEGFGVSDIVVWFVLLFSVMIMIQAYTILFGRMTHVQP